MGSFWYSSKNWSHLTIFRLFKNIRKALLEFCHFILEEATSSLKKSWLASKTWEYRKKITGRYVKRIETATPELFFSERTRQKFGHNLYLRKHLFSRKYFNIFSLLRCFSQMKLIPTGHLLTHWEWCSVITCLLRDEAVWSMAEYVLLFSTWVSVTFLSLTFFQELCGHHS